MKWIKKRRQQLGIETQEELATRLQLAGFPITRSAVSHWENGRYSPPFEDPEFRRAFSQVMRLPEAEIVRLAGYGVSAQYSPEAERAAFIVEQLPSEQRQLALKILEQMLPTSA